jgi:1-deoxy-D-xylulose-5-phosphate reductoisomerase
MSTGSFPPFPRTVTILGSTGSIGEKALAVVAQYPDRFRVKSLAAGRESARLAEQASRFDVARVATSTPGDGQLFSSRVDVRSGPEQVAELASDPDVDVVINGIVGRAGLEASLAALRAGKLLALANKESLVLAGDLIMRTARAHGGRVIPIDSEHSGLFQCLIDRPEGEVRRLVITASGGPFRTRPLAELRQVTPLEALRHPIWPMGPRISVDSATLLNKGLEVIETRWLFDVPSQAIEVWIHPQSVVHALVEWRDGSMTAQLAAPDMILPVQYAMTFPERWPTPVAPCWLPDWKSLEFQDPDPVRFPALALARHALEQGGTSGAVLNAADEVAVDAFLTGAIGFLDIVPLVERVLERIPSQPADSLSAILEADALARETARSFMRA